MMFLQLRRMAAQDLARDFVVTAQAFADTFIQYVAADHAGEETARVVHRRQEICAAVWASILATFEASGFTDEEREKIEPLVREALLPYWRKHCAQDEEFIVHVQDRASHYLQRRDARSQLKTAAGLMEELLASIDAESAKLLPKKTLTALLAHRMLSDLRRLNEIKSSYKID
jgi:hypothetical protein